MHSLYRTLPGLHWLLDVAKDLEFFHLKWRATFSDPHFLRWLMLFSYNHLAPESITGLKADHIEMLGFTDWAVKELHQFIKVHDIVIYDRQRRIIVFNLGFGCVCG